MIPKSGNRFSEKIMLKQQARAPVMIQPRAKRLIMQRPSNVRALTAVLLLGVGLFALPPARALTVAEIANLKGPDREQVLLEGARKEGKVVLYSSMIEDQALRPIAN